MKCNNPNCNYDIDNICIDGLTSEDCPNLVDFSQLELITPDSITEVDDRGKYTDTLNTQQSGATAKTLFPGQIPLSIDEVQTRLKDRLSKVVSFIGPVGVGKTTLISSLYDVFSKENDIQVSFGGSDTLYAFESSCHHARVTSRGSTVSTPRTSSTEGVGFYHLSIQDSKKMRQEFFLADRSGESYSEMINNLSLVDSFDELLRSDLLLFMVDSSSLVNNKQRHLARRTTIKLIQSLFEYNTLPKNTNCAIILTKFDLVVEENNEAVCMSEANRIVDDVQKYLDTPIDILSISARPNTEGHARPDFFKILWQKLELSQRPQKKCPLNKYKTNRSFHNLELMYEY